MDTVVSNSVDPWAVTPLEVDAAVRRAIGVARAERNYLFGSCVNPEADGSPPNDLDRLVVADETPTWARTVVG